MSRIQMRSPRRLRGANRAQGRRERAGFNSVASSALLNQPAKPVRYGSTERRSDSPLARSTRRSTPRSQTAGVPTTVSWVLARVTPV